MCENVTKITKRRDRKVQAAVALIGKKKINIIVFFKRRRVIGCKGGACATNGAAPGPVGLVFGIPLETETKDC